LVIRLANDNECIGNLKQLYLYLAWIIPSTRDYIGWMEEVLMNTAMFCECSECKNAALTVRISLDLTTV